MRGNNAMNISMNIPKVLQTKCIECPISIVLTDISTVVAKSLVFCDGPGRAVRKEIERTGRK
jgi:hypothetical protein